MNKKLLDTKLKSIEHYNQQLKELWETERKLEEVKGELIAGLAEFCPFTTGDILCYDDKQIVKFDHVYDQDEDSAHRPYLTFNVYTCNDYGKFERKTNLHYFFDKADRWTLLKHAKPVEEEAT